MGPLLYHHPPARQDAGLIEAPRRTGPLPYWWTAPDVAETTYTTFQTKPDAGLGSCPAGEAARFPARPLRQTAITPSSPTAWETLELEADHRRHRRGRARHTPTSSTRRRWTHAVLFAGNGAWLEVMGLTWPAGQLASETGSQMLTTNDLRPFATGGTDHPLGAPPQFVSPPALALGNPVQSRLGPAASPIRPDGQPA